MSDKPDKTDLAESALRALYVASSRRSLLVKIGRGVLKAVGISMLPLLPIGRIVTPAQAQGSVCTTWFLCGIYGRVCNCSSCGGTLLVCPSCASQDSGYWQACCEDGHGSTWPVNYYDCCTTDSTCVSNCAQCTFCTNGGEEPPWCGGLQYACTVATTLDSNCS